MDEEIRQLTLSRRHFKQIVERMSEKEFRASVLVRLDAIEGRLIEIQSDGG